MLRIIQNKGKKCKYGKTLLYSMLLCFCFSESVFAKSPESSREKEVENFVQAFFDACSDCDIEKINGFYEEENKEWEIRTRVGKECGIEEYSIQDMSIYPLEDKQETWLVIVSYELWVEGFEVGLPGMQTILVYTVGDNWYLSTSDMNQNNQDLIEQVASVFEEDEVINKILECNQKYEDIYMENENIREWLMEVQDKMTKAVAESLMEENMENADDAAQEETQLKRYIVKKGDCLWRIAKEEMKSGMYWKELYELNKENIGDDPNLIFPGQELQMPQ